MLVVSDIHIGFNRAGGTTPASREKLRNWLYGQVRSLLVNSDETRLVVLGDLFDGYEVPTRDLLDTFALLSRNWLRLDKTIVFIAGNHDNSPRGDRTSSFSALAQMLSTAHPDGVTLLDIGEHDYAGEGVYAVPHCANQDLFDAALRAAYQEHEANPFTHLLLHANYDNGFAAESDHSLNVSEEAARNFTDVGVTLVFAHEHQARTELGGQVVCLGNQWPTSIADCLGNDGKFAHTLNDGRLTQVLTWSSVQEDGGYAEVDWRDLAGTYPNFVRVAGDATAAQAADVINAIATFRQRSEAFVVTNAVRVDGVVALDELPQQFEAVKAFDVLAFIRGQLDERQVAVVEKLLEGA
jgi:metallophosphoesterase superfamily enzyme